MSRSRKPAAAWMGMLASAAAMVLSLSGCASSKAPTDEGSYRLGEKKDGEDPFSLHGTMEVSVGYATEDFPDARRAMGPSRW